MVWLRVGNDATLVASINVRAYSSISQLLCRSISLLLFTMSAFDFKVMLQFASETSTGTICCSYFLCVNFICSQILVCFNIEHIESAHVVKLHVPIHIVTYFYTERVTLLLIFMFRCCYQRL